MFDLRKLLFGGAPQLTPELREAVEAWRKGPAPQLGEPHFHCRYVVLDIATSGPDPDKDELLAIAALGLERGAAIVPNEAVLVEFAGETEALTVDRRLAAFLQYLGQAPLVTYHAPYVEGFLLRCLRQRLGVEYVPRQVDLAWMLPSLFNEVSPLPMPLDQWLGHFEGELPGRRDPMQNTLLLAKLFQRLLARANERGLDTAERLLDESAASTFLRRNH